jgi:hypothetical protein
MIGIDNVYDEVLKMDQGLSAVPQHTGTSRGTCQAYISFCFTFISCVFHTRSIFLFQKMHDEITRLKRTSERILNRILASVREAFRFIDRDALWEFF